MHITLNTGIVEGEEAGVKAYIRSVNFELMFRLMTDYSISAPVGVTPKAENCVFVPVPVELRFHDAERSGGMLPSSARIFPAFRSKSDGKCK